MPDWTDADAVPLREFLAKNPKFIRELEKRIPPATKTETMEAKSLSAERRDGARDMIAVIVTLSEVDEPARRGPQVIDSHRNED